MSQPVVLGASLVCSFGLAPSTIVPTGASRVTIEGRPAATITDVAPMANIPPFGLCSSLANPLVAAATSAALGVLTPMPCTPVPTGPWSPGSPTTTLGGTPALGASSRCQCAWGGSITVVFPGPVRTTVS